MLSLTTYHCTSSRRLRPRQPLIPFCSSVICLFIYLTDHTRSHRFSISVFWPPPSIQIPISSSYLLCTSTRYVVLDPLQQPCMSVCWGVGAIERKSKRPITTLEHSLGFLSKDMIQVRHTDTKIQPRRSPNSRLSHTDRYLLLATSGFT